MCCASKLPVDRQWKLALVRRARGHLAGFSHGMLVLAGPWARRCAQMRGRAAQRTICIDIWNQLGNFGNDQEQPDPRAKAARDGRRSCVWTPAAGWYLSALSQALHGLCGCIRLRIGLTLVNRYSIACCSARAAQGSAIRAAIAHWQHQPISSTQSTRRTAPHSIATAARLALARSDRARAGSRAAAPASKQSHGQILCTRRRPVSSWCCSRGGY